MIPAPQAGSADSAASVPPAVSAASAALAAIVLPAKLADCLFWTERQAERRENTSFKKTE